MPAAKCDWLMPAKKGACMFGSSLTPSKKPNKHRNRADKPLLPYPAKIISAAFSAIITVGLEVLPDVMLGITEASTTRKPPIP